MKIFAVKNEATKQRNMLYRSIARGRDVCARFLWVYGVTSSGMCMIFNSRRIKHRLVALSWIDRSTSACQLVSQSVVQ